MPTLRQEHRSEYAAWGNMKARCLNSGHERWDDYGGRGITICDEWLESFEAFLADMGPKPQGGPYSCSIERRDNEDGYHPGNCYWATPLEQAQNRREAYRANWTGFNIVASLGSDDDRPAPAN